MSQSDARRSIYLVRSARTTLSAEGRFTGRLDPALDDEGRAQARTAARSLADTRIGAVFTSPLRRARQTADVIAREAGFVPEIVDELVDVDAGAWAGLTMSETSSGSPQEFEWFFRMPKAAAFPGGERMWDALNRVLDVLEATAGGASPGDVVVVTHEIPIRLVMVTLKELEGTALWDQSVPPGSIHRLRASSRGLEIPTVLEDLFRAARRGERTGTATHGPARSSDRREERT